MIRAVTSSKSMANGNQVMCTPNFNVGVIIQCNRNCILQRSWRFGVFSPRISPKNRPHIFFSTVCYWLGIAKPKNVPKPFQQVM